MSLEDLENLDRDINRIFGSGYLVDQATHNTCVSGGRGKVKMSQRSQLEKSSWLEKVQGIIGEE